MGPPATDGAIRTYELPEVITVLRSLAEYDWESFFQKRAEAPMDHLALDWVPMTGYRMQYGTQPSEYLDLRDKARKTITALDSIGLILETTGLITTVVPGMAADTAGLAPGMEITGINQRKFSEQRFKDALADSVSRRSIELLVLRGDAYTTLTVSYAEGLKYLELIRDESRPDVLAEILKPLGKD
jgi:predicted metalloprotease with PDZ domain